MGKTIIQQARGKGSFSYRVPKKAFCYRVTYPRKLTGEGQVLKLVNSTAHTYPLAKIKYSDGIFYIPAFKGMAEGMKLNFESKEVNDGNILSLEEIPVKTKVYCIESRPGDGGKFIKSGGNLAVVSRIIGDEIFVIMPSKKEKSFNKKCRAIIGVIAGAQRLDKPIVKAGKNFYIRKSKNKLWPRTSAVKFNAIDHPFGSGRGKRIKQKIPKRNSPPGAKVGLLSARRTGKKK